MIGSIRLFKVVILLCMLFLSGCESVKAYVKNNYSPKVKVVEKPVVMRAVPVMRPEIIEVVEDKSPDMFLVHLHSARLNLAAYNREKALSSLKMAFDKVKERKDFEQNGVVALKMEFAKKGFASTPTYLTLGDEHKEQLLQIISDAKESKQELLSISLMQPTSPLASEEIISKLGEAVKALNEVNLEAPDYDFAIADRAVRDIYEAWNVTPYESDSMVEAKYYLNAAQVLIGEGNFDLAEDLLESAEKSYSRSYAHNVFNSNNYEFVSYYKSTSMNIRRIIEKDKTIQKRVNRKVKGVLDYFF